MSWIKRNLSLVISGLIAVGLLGFGGWYLWSAIDKNNQIDGEINQTKSEIERLLNSDPTPNQQNLTLAKQEAAKLAAFIVEAKKQFPPTPGANEPLNDLSFRSLLETTVNGLHREASSVGIRIGDRTETELYYFTFEAQKTAMRFPPESLRPLRERLHEVRQIAEILFKARINRLVWMKRAAVPGERSQPGGVGSAAAADYLSASPRTNAEANMVLWPYEVQFECFSPELAEVIEALERTPGVILKSPMVETIEAPMARSRQTVTNVPPRNIPGQNPPRANVPAATPGLITIINERPLRATLRIEVIKPEPPQPPGGPGPRRGGPPQP